MDSPKQIEQYLSELAQVLNELQVPVAFHMLIPGGAWMLLHKMRRSTLDIDFALVEVPNGIPNREFRVTVQRAEVAKNAVEYSTEFKEAVDIVARRHRNLPDDWLNDEAAVYYYDDAPEAQVKFWRSFGDVLYVYLPTMQYMFATKIAAYRQKDQSDIQILMKKLKIRTRVKAQQIIDEFLLPDAQEFWEVEEKLRRLFRE